MNILFSTKYM